jgi:hypothetical protein
LMIRIKYLETDILINIRPNGVLFLSKDVFNINKKNERWFGVEWTAIASLSRLYGFSSFSILLCMVVL